MRYPAFGLLLVLASFAHAAEPTVLADFEGKTYGAWTIEGDCFGTGPARGTLSNQNRVSGFLGRGLVNTFLGGDDTMGTATSPEFRVDRDCLNFLIGGGAFKGKTCLDLLLDGKVVRTATGRSSETLDWQSWDVRDLRGKTVRLRIVDRATGGWGHINVDHIVLADQPAFDMLIADFEGKDYGDWKVEGDCFGPGPAQGTLERQNPVSGYLGKGLVNTYYKGDNTTGKATSPAFVIERDYLNFLVGGGAHEGQTGMYLLIDGKIERRAMGKNNETLTWYTWDLRRLQGKTAQLQIVDTAKGGWGHINIDQIVASNRPMTTPRGDPELEAKLVAEQRRRVLGKLREHGVSDIVFTVRMSDPDGHWYANFSYWSNNPNRKLYHPGGKLCRMNVETGEVKLLIDDPKGGVRDPQIHYDGTKMILSYRPGDSPFYHLYEMNVDGSGLRQLTDGPYDDIEPTYLPDGGIIFASSRCNRMVNCYFVRVANIYRCDGDGGNIRPLSSNIEQDNTPWVMPDGRILHQRWEYIDRSQVWFHHLWTMNPDGTDQMVYFGNLHPSTVMLDAKPIPGTQKVVASFSPGHGRNEHEGYVTIVDPRLGPDYRPFARSVSPTMYRDPYPLSEDLFLVSYNQQIGTLDGDGEYTPLFSMPEDWRAGDGRMRAQEPRPIRPRAREHIIPSRVDLSRDTGTLTLEAVHLGRNMVGVERGEIKRLLVLEALPKPVNFTGGWEPISFGGTFTLERVLGTVPVEEDGSAHFEVPALRSIFFVALDQNGRSVKRMQSFLTVQPGESFSCVGCHEPRTQTPRNHASRRGRGLAMARPADRIQPIGQGLPDVYDFPRDIQPILDRHCVACHGYEKTAKGGPRAGGAILAGDHGPQYCQSYIELTLRNQFTDGRNSGGNKPPRAIGSGNSPLLDKLAGGHHGVQATAREQLAVRLWIDSAAPYPGTYAALGTGMVGRNRRTEGWAKQTDEVLARRCASCHTDARRLPMHPGDDVLSLGFGGTRLNHSDPRYRYSNHRLFNLTRPEHSLLLLAPLAANAGGYAETPAAKGGNDQGHKTVFASTNDPDYQALLAAVTATKAQLERIKRFDMPGFRPNEHYIREMKVYGVLPRDLPADAAIDVYAADQAYWRSLWYQPR
jgi:mono/diheme cytochrome c family protein